MVKKVNVLLTKNDSILGYKGDVISVAQGFARNFLFRKGMAVVMSDRMERARAKLLAEAAEEISIKRSEAQEIIAKSGLKTIEIRVSVDVKGGMYGSVTSTQLAELISNLTGLEIKKKDILLTSPIRHIGNHKVSYRAFKHGSDEILGEVIVSIVSEKEKMTKRIVDEEAKEESEESSKEVSEESSEEASEDSIESEEASEEIEE